MMKRVLVLVDDDDKHEIVYDCMVSFRCKTVAFQWMTVGVLQRRFLYSMPRTPPSVIVLLSRIFLPGRTRRGPIQLHLAIRVHNRAKSFHLSPFLFVLIPKTSTPLYNQLILIPPPRVRP